MVSIKVSDKVTTLSLRLLLAASFVVGVQFSSPSQFASGQERNERPAFIHRADHRGENLHPKAVPVPVLGLALIGLGIGLFRKRKQLISPKK